MTIHTASKNISSIHDITFFKEMCVCVGGGGGGGGPHYIYIRYM